MPPKPRVGTSFRHIFNPESPMFPTVTNPGQRAHLCQKSPKNRCELPVFAPKMYENQCPVPTFPRIPITFRSTFHPRLQLVVKIDIQMIEK